MISDRIPTTITARPRRTFSRFDPIVYTTLFHWFTKDGGNVTGPWAPVEGRQLWTGEKDWWITQIKQIMMANIDMVHVHLIPRFEEQRLALFAAFHELRNQGYDVPKVVPFLDPFGIWPPAKVDVGSKRGKDEVVSHYIRFFEQYFSGTADANHAAQYLGTIDGHAVLSTWWVYTILENLNSFTRDDIESRLRRTFAGKTNVFDTGIHMVSTALIDPDLTFSDERAVLFSGFAYCLQSIHKDVRTYHVQAGYWDQNLRPTGFRLPRDGGRPYKEAWDYILTQAEYTHRVYIESWNEYDEGSGIYAADPYRIYTPPGISLTRSDRWSDVDDPFEYIRTTSNGAARFNRLPMYDALILRHNFPQRMMPGERRQVTVLVRNEGNTAWSSSNEISFALLKASAAQDTWARSCGINDDNNEVRTYGGIFRGRPVQFDLEIQAPTKPDTYQLVWGMKHPQQSFGPPLSVSITVL